MPKAEFDWRPIALLFGVLLAGWPLIGSSSTWVTLTVAGLAMGLIIFIIASGLTLIFGLMDVLNFGHGVFIALGAFVATSVMGGMADWSTADSAWAQPGRGVRRDGWRRWLAAGVLGLAFERVIVRPVYGQHLKQILITMGGMIVGEELIKVIWGPQQIALPLPEALRGASSSATRRSRSTACWRWSSAWSCSPLLLYALNRTKIGLLIRAGVQDREMVEALGYRIRRLFVGVFVAGSALAGLGGVMWGLYQQSGDAADRRAGQRADLHRHHHRRAGLARWAASSARCWSG